MYEQALGMMAEPAYIKANLPIAFVAEQAGVRLTSDGSRLSGICPFHADHDPSFDIYPWGQGERFGCFACGASGDVLDFMQRFWSLGFRDAVEMGHRGIARIQALGWTAPTLGAVFEWDADAGEDLLRRASIEGMDQIVAAKHWIFPARDLASWGCRTMNGQLLVPYRDENNALVGIKHRPLNGSRPLVSLPGSRLRTTLYAIETCGDLDIGDEVLLCEGESDVWTASHLVGRYGWFVVGLPAGAGAAPCRTDLLRRCNVTIAFDGDEAGRLSAARWAGVLGPRTRILDIPDGEDITSMSGAGAGWLLGKLGGT